MLSLQRCREILGPNCRLNDQDLERLRDQMYGLADVTIAQLGDCRSNQSKTYYGPPKLDNNAFKAALKLLPNEESEEVEERAGIIEFDAGIDRDEAERQAVLCTIRKRHENK